MFGHVADAAFVCNCSGALFAVQRVSPEQPFKLVTHAESQTDLSLHGAGTHMSRDEAGIRRCRFKVGFCLFIDTVSVQLQLDGSEEYP